MANIDRGHIGKRRRNRKAWWEGKRCVYKGSRGAVRERARGGATEQNNGSGGALAQQKQWGRGGQGQCKAGG